jgi:hypothetical protein
METNYYIVTRNKANQIDKLIVTDMEKAKKFVANIGNKTFYHKGKNIEILGLYSENEVETIEMLHHDKPRHYNQWRENMLHLKRTKQWPKQ